MALREIIALRWPRSRGRGGGQRMLNAGLLSLELKSQHGISGREAGGSLLRG